MALVSSWDDPQISTTITAGGSPYTLINVFTTKEGQQQAFCDAQIGEYRRLAGKFPGQLTINLHKGRDGRKVVNYAQFVDEDAYRAWRESDEFVEHMAIIEPFLDKVEPGFYEVAYIQHAPPTD